MIKKEIGGRTYYCWTDNEQKAKEEFESAISARRAIELLCESMLKAACKATAESNRAWETVRKVSGLPEDAQDKSLTYAWLIGGFRVKDE